MCIDRISTIKPRISHWIACHIGGYCPTQKEIEDKEVIELAKRLKGESKKETLTNILEWQEANINFWDERHITPTALFYSIGVIFPIFLSLGVVLSLFWLLVFQAYILPSMILIWISAFTSSLITAIALAAITIKLNRKIPWKDGLFNAFRISISIRLLLRRDRKFGICRDYAKLTACLLSNIDKSNEIFFVRSLGHVAAGTKIGEQLYMLDQVLPLLTIDQWYKREHGSNPPAKILFVYRNAQKLSGNKLVSVPLDNLLSKTNRIKVNSPQALAAELSKLLNIKNNIGMEQSDTTTIDLPRWTKGADLYEMSDEVVTYSLVRSLKRKISNQVIDLSQITNVDAKRDEPHLIFQISCKRKN